MKTGLIKILLSVLFSFVSLRICYSQQNLFLKVLKCDSSKMFSNAEIVFDTLSNSSFIVSGSYGFFSQPDSTVTSFIIKNNVSGYTNWFMNYRAPNKSLAIWDVKVLTNKNIIVGGQYNERYANGNLIGDGFLMITDSNSVIKKAKYFPLQHFQKLIQLKNGNITVVFADSLKFFKVCTFDQSLNLKWSVKLFSDKIPLIYINMNCDIKEGKDGRIAIMGNKLNSEGFIVLLDSLGNKINDVNANSSSNSLSFYEMTLNSDQYYYVSGTRLTANPPSTIVVLAGIISKFDSNLNLKWFKAYYTPLSGGAMEFTGIKSFNSNNMVVHIEPEGPIGRRSALGFIDSSGKMSKSFSYGSDSLASFPSRLSLLKSGQILFNSFFDEYFFGVTDSINHNFCGYVNMPLVVIDSTQNFVYNTFTVQTSTINSLDLLIKQFLRNDVWLEYKCSSGPSGPYQNYNMLNLKSIEKNDNLSVFPNPANEFLYIRINESEQFGKFPILNLKIIDVLGKTAMENRITPNRNLIKIETKNLLEGIYYLSITNGEKKESWKKIIINH